jgi:hypothetical protein
LSATLDLARLGNDQRDGLHVLGILAARPGVTDLRFFVRVGRSGPTGALRHSLDVPVFVDGQARVSLPLGARSVPGMPVARLETDSRPPSEIPFRLGATPFLPDASPVLTPRQARDLCVFVWPSRGAAGALEVTGEIQGPGQDPVPLVIPDAPRVVSDPDGFDRYLVSVVAPAAPPGDYVLRLRFREAGGGTSLVSTTTAALRE